MTILIVFTVLMGLGITFTAGYLSGFAGHARKLKRDEQVQRLIEQGTDRRIIERTIGRPTNTPPSDFYRKD